MTRPFSFKAFLSHRYKSPNENLFFFDLFAEQAEVKFAVDRGVSYTPIGSDKLVTQVPTNVTRLERMLRDADAFIGVYPLSLPHNVAATPQQLRDESRYFLLELELAIRCGKPAFVASDKRYKSMLEGPAAFYRCEFDAQQLTRGQEAPAFKKTFRDFCQTVKAQIAYRASRGAQLQGNGVGLLLPPSSYDADARAAIDAALKENGYLPVPLPWPPICGRELQVAASKLDWLIADVGDEPQSATAVAFLHGQFVPTVRLSRQTAGTDVSAALQRTLYGGVSVGYPKDIVRWETLAQLQQQLRARIQVIDLEPTLVRSRAEAEDYFASAAKRNINIFLSFAGANRDVAMKISEALSARFAKVFNYRDGKSIQPGQPWLDEIFKELAGSAVAIPLLSTEYLASGNCEHEARQMVALHDGQGLHVIPVKLTDKSLPIWDWLSATQAERAFSVHRNPEELAELIVRLVEAHETSKSAAGERARPLV